MILMPMAYRMAMHSFWKSMGRKRFANLMGQERADQECVIEQVGQELMQYLLPPHVMARCFLLTMHKNQNKINSTVKRVFNEGQLFPTMIQVVEYMEKLYDAILFLNFSRPPGVMKFYMDTFFLVFVTTILGFK